MSSNSPRLDQLERNLIINGNMDFGQRGTSFTGAAATGSYTLDRWILNQGSGAISWTVDRPSDAPTQAQSGFNSTFSLRYTQGATTSATGCLFNYRIEGSDYQALHNRKFRLQFWAKSSIAGTYGVVLENSAETRYYATTYSIASANTWTKITLDLIGDSSGTWNFDNTLGLQIWFGFSQGSGQGVITSTLNTWTTTASAVRQVSGTVSTLSGTNGATFQLAQVMLLPQDFTQAGSTTVDVPFQRAGRNIGHELQLCQRYYYKTFNQGVAPASASGVPGGAIAYRAYISGTSQVVSISTRFSEPLRTASPTITFFNPINSGSNWYNASVGANSGASGQDAVGETGLSVVNNTQVAGDLVTNLIYIHYTADAEL